MLHTLSKYMAAAVLALSVGVATADTTYTPGVVTFDSLPNTAGANVASGYEGFTWGNGLYARTEPGAENDYVAFTSSGGRTIVRTDGQGFYFDSADFFLRPGADTNDFSLVLYGKDANGAVVSVYNGLTEKYGRNHIVYDPAVPGKLTTFQAILEGSNGKEAGAYSGLVYGVAIAFDNTGYTDIGMDNFRFRAADAMDIAAPVMPQVTAVPEVETYAMLLAGLGLMGTIIRRRQHQA
jgi:hypothetical protein